MSIPVKTKMEELCKKDVMQRSFCVWHSVSDVEYAATGCKIVNLSLQDTSTLTWKEKTRERRYSHFFLTRKFHLEQSSLQQWNPVRLFGLSSESLLSQETAPRFALPSQSPWGLQTWLHTWLQLDRSAWCKGMLVCRWLKNLWQMLKYSKRG